MVEKLPTEFRYGERLERENRRCRGGQLGLDLGRDSRSRFLLWPGAMKTLSCLGLTT